MSASAEVYLTITADRTKSPSLYPELVDKWLYDAGFIIDGENYRRSSLQSGDIYEVRGYHVSYDVFRDEWCEQLVKKFYELDKELDVEVYVYNLEREADSSATTMRIADDSDEPQGCSHCFNPDFSCACTGGVGGHIKEEVVK
jgi:hypothetical protein